MSKVVLQPDMPLKIAILAMGGQGGGVLAGWIVEMAERTGWWAQTTSVPGVAQRTGATIYYLELLPGEAVTAAGRSPVLAMAPTPGDVDLVVAAELMEAGRAMQRGLVTPERTTLIASGHRNYAIGEKAAPGNGIVDPNKVIDAGRVTAKRMLCLDLQRIAECAGSVISASLFGAIAGAGVLPFAREAFEETIRYGGKGAQASLRAFALGFDAARAAPEVPAPVEEEARPIAEPAAQASHPAVQALLDEVRQRFAPATHDMLVAGLRRLIDYQDVAYASEYLARLADVHAHDAALGGARRDWALTRAMAQRLAVAMSYDDVIRVADLKTRGSRFARVRETVGAAPGQLVHLTEFMHPRFDELCGTLPVRLGCWLERSPRLCGFITRRMKHGLRVHTTSLGWFLVLYALAGMRRFRRAMLRHEIETGAIQRWFDRVILLAACDYALAVEATHCRRLVKGYSGTHERGEERYARLMEAAERLAGRSDAAATLKMLHAAARADEDGALLAAEWARVFELQDAGDSSRGPLCCTPPLAEE